jgi:hypothetical protein
VKFLCGCIIETSKYAKERTRSGSEKNGMDSDSIHHFILLIDEDDSNDHNNDNKKNELFEEEEGRRKHFDGLGFQSDVSIPSPAKHLT